MMCAHRVQRARLMLGGVLPTSAHVVEYSFEQGCFHVQELWHAVAGNLESFVMDQPVSYLPLAICANREEASAICSKLQAIRNRRVAKSSGDGEEGEDDERGA